MQAFLVAAAAGGLLSASATAAVIAEHLGSNDPHGEAVSSTNSTDWTRYGTTAYGSALAADPVAGTPAAWEINDTGGGFLYYHYDPSSQENADAGADGWKLSLDARVNGANVALNGSSYNQYANGSKTYTVFLGSDADGNPMIKVNGTTFTVTDGDGDNTNNVKFHLYELVYDHTAQTADLFVDGAATSVNNIAATSSSTNQVTWGAGSSAGQGSMDYALVRLETLPVPEPASLGALALGGLLLMRRRES
jgi:hypothetical protein